jgi:hypothetical protein
MVMDRRIDEITAERINIALLTRAAFDMRTALTFATLSGLKHEFAEDVLSRPPAQIRHYPTMFLLPPDRRRCAR